MKLIRFFSTLIFSLLACCCLSCSGFQRLSAIEKSSCYHQSDYQYTKEDLPKPLSGQTLDPQLTTHFSAQSLNVANAIGLLESLSKYLKIKNDYLRNRSLEKRIFLIEISQTIYQKIATSSLEISSATSELDCEEERTSQIYNYLKSTKDNQDNQLIVSSIVIGAAGSITAEILSNDESTAKASTVVAIGTSIIEAGFGVLMLINKKKHY